MKTISCSIYDYFLIRGLFDKNINGSKITEVKYISPCNKLKLVNDGDVKELVKVKGDESKTYKITKSLSVKYCKELIEPFDEWKEVLNLNKKKDDLADSLLQGLYYIKNVVKRIFIIK